VDGDCRAGESRDAKGQSAFDSAHHPLAPPSPNHAPTHPLTHFTIQTRRSIANSSLARGLIRYYSYLVWRASPRKGGSLDTLFATFNIQIAALRGIMFPAISKPSLLRPVAEIDRSRRPTCRGKLISTSGVDSEHVLVQTDSPHLNRLQLRQDLGLSGLAVTTHASDTCPSLD